MIFELFEIENDELIKIGLIENYISAIWTSRYYAAGDFEIYLSANEEIVSNIHRDLFIHKIDDDEIGFVEKIEIKGDIEKGNTILISGRFATALLARRVILEQTNFYNRNIVSLICDLINQNTVNPTIAQRKIPTLNLGLQSTANDSVTMQVTGDNLYTKICDLCKLYGLGFKMVLKHLNNSYKIYFEIRKGIDRSFNQAVNPYVIFSEEFGNIASSTYVENQDKKITFVLIAGEGEGTARKTASINNAVSGIARFEAYIDNRDTSSNESEITESEYMQMLEAKGKEALQDIEYLLDGEIIDTSQYVYKVDINVGDIVSVEDFAKRSRSARIVEAIESYDDTGQKLVLTYEKEGG